MMTRAQIKELKDRLDIARTCAHSLTSFLREAHSISCEKGETASLVLIDLITDASELQSKIATLETIIKERK